MHQTRNGYIRTLLLSTILFILGQFVFVSLFEFFEPRFAFVTIRVIESTTGIRTSLLFSINLFLIPILILITWRFSPIISTNKKITSVFTILAFISLAIFIRHIEVKAFYTHLIKNHFIAIKENQSAIQSIDPVNFVYYMFGGLCAGCIVSFLLLRQKNVKTE